jgi:hypothetical protein
VNVRASYQPPDRRAMAYKDASLRIILPARDPEDGLGAMAWEGPGSINCGAWGCRIFAMRATAM